MLIDPRHLEQLSAIVDIGTLHGAAKEIGTSQPALSRMIRTLESRFGISLFEKNSRPLKPTALGYELANQGRAIRVTRERASQIVDLGSLGFSGDLKIGAPPFLCERLVSEAISDFVTRNPATRVSLVPDYFPRLQARLAENEIDIIVGPPKLVDPSFSELLLEPLFQDINVIVGRAGHPLLGTDLSKGELEQATWVGHSERSMLRHEMEIALRLMGIRDLRLAFQSESAGAVIEMLRTSDFLTVLPRYALRTDGSDGLAIFSLDIPQSAQTVAMITHAHRDETSLTGEFKDHLRSYVSRRASAQ